MKKSIITINHNCYGHGEHGNGKVCFLLMQIYNILKEYPDDKIEVKVIKKWENL